MSESSPDFYDLEDLLEPEEIEIRDRVRTFCEKEVTPHINEYWERAEFPFDLVPKIAQLGISGGAVGLETSARRDGDSYVLNGQKKWIGNGSIADHVIIWARGEDGAVGGYVVDKGTPGYEARVMTGKTALRAVWQAEITLTDVRVPAENRLAGCHGFTDVSRVLDRTRYTLAWRALGLATASYELALAHALRREQFGQPIAGYQLVQDKLARMLAEITAMQLMCWRLSKLADAGRMTAAMASLAKMNHAAKARAIVADARDILGGDGILLDNHVARHHADMEAIFTFEGTDSVQALIVGRAVTGLSAISGRRSERRG